MRKMILCALLFSSGTLLAQQNETMKPFRSQIYGGFGWMLPSSGMKENSMIGTGTSFRFGYFQGIGKPFKTANGQVQLGAELRLEYSKFPHELRMPSVLTDLRYDNGTATPARLNPELYAKDKKPDAFQYLIGPSALYTSGRTFIQPSLLFGYASVSQEEFSYYETIRFQGTPNQSAPVELYGGTHETNNGFAWTPGVKAGYRLSKRISVFADLTYTFGSKQDFSDYILAPLGPPNDQGVYSFNQLRSAPVNTYSRQSTFRALFLSGNIALTF